MSGSEDAEDTAVNNNDKFLLLWNLQSNGASEGPRNLCFYKIPM